MRYRHLRRTIIALMATVAILMTVVMIALQVLHSDWACERAARYLEHRVAGELDATLEIDRLEWRMLPPRVLLQGVHFTRDGITAEVDSLEVSLSEVWLLRPRLRLGTVAADGVTLRLQGIPKRPESRRSSPLRIEVEQLDIHRLRFEGIALSRTFERLAVRGLDTGWAADGKEHIGYARIDQVLLELRGVEPIEAAVRCRFRAQTSLELLSWAVTATGLELRGTGEVSREGRIQLAGRGSVQLEEVDRVVRARGVLEGSCELDLTLDSSRDDLLEIAVSSPRVVAEDFPVQHMRGRLLISQERLHGVLEQARFHGGTVSGSYTLGAGMRRPFPHQVRVRASGVSVAGLLRDLRVPAAGLSATIDTDVELAWQGRRIKQGNGRATAVLSPVDGPLPVSGELQVRLTPEGLLRFEAEQLQAGGSTIRWQGPLTVGSWVPAWSFRANPAVLEELLPMINVWIGDQVLPEQLSGSGELQVTIAGPWKRLQAGIRLETGRLVFPPMVVDRLLAEAQVSGQTLSIGSARCQLAGGTAELAGRLSWQEGSPEDQLDLDLRGQAIPLHALAGWLGIDDGISGTLAFTGGLRGPLSSPRGSWAVALGGMEVAGLVLGDGSATLDLADGTLAARGLAFSEGLLGGVQWQVARQEVSADLSWPGMPLSLAGQRVADLLGGHADLSTRFLWSESRPLVGELRISGEAARLELDMDEQRLSASGTLRDAVTGSLQLERDTDNHLRGDGQVELVAADRFVASLFPDAGVPLSGRGHLAFSADWPQGGWPTLSGRAESLELVLAGRPLELVQPAPFTLSRDGLQIDGVQLSLLDDAITLHGGIDRDGSLSGTVSGTLDALLLRFLVPGWEPAGRITGEVEILGTVKRPLLEGTTELADVSFRLPGSRQVVSHINGTVMLSPNEVRIAGVDLRYLQGSASCSGRITAAGEVVELQLGGSLRDLEYQLLPGLTPVLHGSWQLEGPVDQLELSGDLEIDRAVLRRQDDLMTILLDWFSSEVATGGTGIGLNLRVEADRTIEARSPFLSITGSASLLVTGTSVRPGLVGTVEIHEGGDFSFQGVRYEVERGTLSFSDPMRIDPLVELQARAWVQSYQVTVRLSGTTERLVPVLSSDPPLSEGEIISLLALGRPDESVGGGAMGVGLASTLLTRQLNAELERRARTLLPVDQVRVDPFAEHATGNPAARVTLVKQLSSSWTIILQSNLSSNREEVVVSRWFLAPGVFLEATRDVDGSYGIDLKMRRSY